MDLSILHDLASRLELAKKKKKRAELDLAAANEEIDQIVTGDVPWALDGLECRVPVGSVIPTSKGPVKYKQTVEGRILSADRDEAHRWLEENGEGGMVKQTVTIDLGKGKGKEAFDLVNELRAKGHRALAKKDVHHMTLSSWVRGRLDRGELVPDSVTVYTKHFLEATDVDE